MLTRSLLLIAALAAPAWAAEDAGGQAGPAPLERLAARVPADTQGMIVLTDVAASLAASAPLAKDFDALNRRMMAYTPLTLIDGYDLSSAFEVVIGDGLEPVMGFETDHVGQVASWRAERDAPVVIAGLADRAEAIARALEARDFARATRFGTEVWHRQADFETDAQRSGEDPFAQRDGHPERFAFDGGFLLFARSWAGLEPLLAPGPGFAGDADVAAILRAGYMATGRGRLLEAILLGPQVPREAGVRAAVGSGPGDEARIAEILARPGMDAEPMPPWRRHALLLWQDGLRISGAVAIPYPDRETAERAQARFEDLLVRIVSLVAPKSFDELLPYGRYFTVVETGDRAVLLLAFEEIGGAYGVTPMMFIINPYDRLRDMQFAGDLPVLLGGR